MPEEEDAGQRVRRLIVECMEIIPKYTSGRGSFSSMPEMGYDARHPPDWQLEFVELLGVQPIQGLAPDADEIVPMVGLLNEVTLSGDSLWNVSTQTLSSVLGYVVLEMLLRRLTPVLDSWGYLTAPVEGFTPFTRISGLMNVLLVFERTTELQALADDFRSLNAAMSSSEPDRRGEAISVNLYGRLERGRNLMLHGNLSHSFEGSLLVLLVDLIMLHAMSVPNQ